MRRLIVGVKSSTKAEDQGNGVARLRLRQFARIAARMERKTVCAIKGVSSNQLAGQKAGYHFHS
jgi:hypothetical protein